MVATCFPIQAAVPKHQLEKISLFAVVFQRALYSIKKSLKSGEFFYFDLFQRRPNSLLID
jgi:hypothetical protein